MGQKISPQKQPAKTEQKDIIFIYDLKSTVKHFLAGTCVENDVDNLTRYDDYELIQYKRGLEIKSLTLYKEDNKIVGLQIIYKDNDKKDLKLQRIAPKYKKSNLRNSQQLKLGYNEHLTDIDIVYTHDFIRSIEISTSKGGSLKVGTSTENGYTSVSRVGTQQKTYMAIVAFEMTFSHDALKELFVYRAPVRFSKRKKRTEMTVNEINRLKAAPNLNSLKKAQQNIQKLKDVTMRSIMQLKALKTFQALGKKQESESPNAQNDDKNENNDNNNKNSAEAQKTPNEIKEDDEEKEEKEDNYMEEQDFGIDPEANEANEREKEKKLETPKKEPIKTAQFPGSSLFINLFKRKDSTNSSSKDPQSNENSPAQSSLSKKGSAKVFSFLRLDSLKKLVGINSPGSAKSSESQPKNKSKFSQEANRISPYQDLKDVGLSRENLILENTISPSNQYNNQRRKITIDEALANWDSMGYESHQGSPVHGSTTSLKAKTFKFGETERENLPNPKKMSVRERLKMNLIEVKTYKERENYKSPSSSSGSGEEVKDFSQALKQYGIFDKSAQEFGKSGKLKNNVLISSSQVKRDIRREMLEESSIYKAKPKFNPFVPSRENSLGKGVSKEFDSSTKAGINRPEAKINNENIQHGVAKKRTLRKISDDSRLEILNSVRSKDFISPKQNEFDGY